MRGSIFESGPERLLVPDVVRQLQSLHGRAGGGKLLHELPGVVAAAVIDIEDAARANHVVLHERIEEGCEAAVRLAEHLFLVVARDDDV